MPSKRYNVLNELLTLLLSDVSLGLTGGEITYKEREITDLDFISFPYVDIVDDDEILENQPNSYVHGILEAKARFYFVDPTYSDIDTFTVNVKKLWHNNRILSGLALWTRIPRFLTLTSHREHIFVELRNTWNIEYRYSGSDPTI